MSGTGSERREFTIYRDSWRRGGDFGELLEKFGDTSLLNGRGMMCCLGQCALELGAKPSSIAAVGEPGDVDSDAREILTGVLLYDDDGRVRETKLTGRAMEINDDASIEDGPREAKLSALFAKYGFQLSFVDGIAPWKVTA